MKMPMRHKKKEKIKALRKSIMIDEIKSIERFIKQLEKEDKL